MKEESEWQRTEVSLVTNESHSDKYESEIGGEQATVAWDSNMAGCFIVLDKLDGAATDKAEINTRVAFIQLLPVNQKIVLSTTQI